MRGAVSFPKMLADLFFALLTMYLPVRKQKGLVLQHCESLR